MQLKGQNILITGGARRIGREIALFLASKGANISLHYGHSSEAAEKTRKDIEALNVNCFLFQADLADLSSVSNLVKSANEQQALDALINNAAIFGNNNLESTSLADWQEHLDINLSAPFLLSKSLFQLSEKTQREARIVNILDWRALRPRDDHLAYTISKAALAALTRSLAIAMAPRTTVNGIALGAILPPSDGADTSMITKDIPLDRWAELHEVGETVEFLLGGPKYITGEIIYLDGGRHLI